MAEPLPHPAPWSPTAGSETNGASLVSVLDRLLETGVVADGQLVVSVAGVDLIYIGLRALIASVDTASRMALVPGREPVA
jgi:hypothetical protein